ncbi:4716_t:CDS:1, partial [Ambispora gerdemannii]
EMSPPIEGTRRCLNKVNMLSCGRRTKIRHMSQHTHGQGNNLLEFLALRCTNADTRSSTWLKKVALQG